MSIDNDIPVLSFPAILRNPGLNNLYAHLHSGSGPRQQAHTPPTIKKKQRNQNEGKRWARRKDNARFVGNPHIAAATKRDYTVPLPTVQSTFPEPLPPYLPRNVKLSTTPTVPSTDPSSANAGRFSLSLKGMRKDLRRAGGRAQALVRDVESEMIQWLTTGETVLFPDMNHSGQGGLQGPGAPIGATGSIFEISRTPLQLVWRITDDAFARYVVHCCARYHEVVSFSKGDPDERLTYLLRPNVTRPDRRIPAAIETPPVTDIDYSSSPDTDDNMDSDFVPEHERYSCMEMDSKNQNLAAIEESTSRLSLPVIDEDAWLHVEGEASADDSELDEFESSSEFGTTSLELLLPLMEGLSIQHGPVSSQLASDILTTTASNVDPDRTLPEIDYRTSPRYRDWTSSARSPSSPSRSPVRKRPSRRRRHAKKRVQINGISDSRSFYEYLFL
ncbi:hypothetical protein BDN70DRAFT_868408 [Pholiota conissans]|uniref:Uncharacterized protein n=1 Tax=Pholiota conissans TaxID=109636 RepID=A0A9P5YMC6_9AGAR|nr:hypothetical protein BDN70DRAFT_868408 [Pholiota conissans]